MDLSTIWSHLIDLRGTGMKKRKWGVWGKEANALVHRADRKTLKENFWEENKNLGDCTRRRQQADGKIIQRFDKS